MARATLPTNYVYSEGTQAIDSTGTVGSSATTWIKSETGSATVASSTNVTYNGGATIRFQAPAVAGSNAFATAAVNLDMSAAATISIALYTSEYITSVANQVTIYFITSTPGTADLRSVLMTVLKPGWNIITRPISDFSTTGSPSWATIRQIRVRIDSNASVARDIYFGGIWYNKRNRPKICICYDDGYDDTVLTIDPYCTTKKLPVSYGIIPSLIDNPGGSYLSTAELTTLAASSYAEICCHDVDRWADEVFVPYGEAYLLNRLATIQSFVAKYDPVGAQYAMIPEGDYGIYTDGLWKTFLPAFRKSNFKGARTIVPNNTTTVPFIMDGIVGVGDLLLAPAYINMNNTTTLAAAKTAVDNAIKYGGNCIVYGHKVDVAADSLTWTTSDFQAYMDYIATMRDLGLIDVMFFSAWYRGMTRGRAFYYS